VTRSQGRVERLKAKAEQPAHAPRKRACVVDPGCMEDLQWWVATQPKIATKVLELMEQVLREPFSGTGKPEPLKQLGPNTWSRRVTGEHRLVYVVADERVTFTQARMHY
jgi:toxin YoeB